MTKRTSRFRTKLVGALAVLIIGLGIAFHFGGSLDMAGILQQMHGG